MPNLFEKFNQDRFEVLFWRADYAVDVEAWLSTSVYDVKFCDAPISWVHRSLWCYESFHGNRVNVPKPPVIAANIVTSHSKFVILSKV